MLLGINVQMHRDLWNQSILSHVDETSEAASMGNMTRSTYNELKICVLSLLKEQEELSSKATTVALCTLLGREASLRSIEMALLRYHRLGLLERTGRRGAYVYKLSEKGRRRLEWLASQRFDPSKSPA